MLVLSRYYNEQIVIIPDGWPSDKPPITVEIVDIRGSGQQAKVRLGITAPNNVQVHRREVFEAILREQRRIQADNELYKNIKDSDPE
jgi:carbon storage regulator